LLGYAKEWGFVNNFLQLVAFTGPAATLIAIDLFVLTPAGEAGAMIANNRDAARTLAVVQAAFLVGRMFVGDFFRPQRCQSDRAASLAKEVAMLDGDVLSPIHPFVPIAAGHTEPQAPLIPYLDAINSHTIPGDIRNYVGLIEQRKPEWILLTGHPEEL